MNGTLVVDVVSMFVNAKSLKHPLQDPLGRPGSKVELQYGMGGGLVNFWTGPLRPKSPVQYKT